LWTPPKYSELATNWRTAPRTDPQDLLRKSEWRIPPYSSLLETKKVDDPKTVANRVAEIFSQNLHVEVPSHDSDLFTAGILDSLQLVELLFQLEEQFGIQISLGDIDLENFRSIDCIALLLVHQNGNGAED